MYVFSKVISRWYKRSKACLSDAHDASARTEPDPRLLNSGTVLRYTILHVSAGVYHRIQVVGMTVHLPDETIRPHSVLYLRATGERQLSHSPDHRHRKSMHQRSMVVFSGPFLTTESKGERLACTSKSVVEWDPLICVVDTGHVFQFKEDCVVGL